MSHRSRLCSVLVDVPRADRDRVAAFWTTALGRDPVVPGNHPDYSWFNEVTPGIVFMVQGTGDAGPRAHFDIETDDVEAEVARLRAAGATEIGRHHSWVVMNDPAGTVFCVVQVQVADAFEAHATTWD